VYHHAWYILKYIKNFQKDQAWWYTFVIPASGKHRQEDSGSKLIPGKTVKPYLKNNFSKKG
jgi:hypothetical protein